MEPQSPLSERPQASTSERVLADLAARVSARVAALDDRAIHVLDNGDEEVEGDDLREDENTPEELQLQDIHAALAATVASMRQRKQEQQHLHQLAISKLEAVAQTCVGQREQLDNMNRTVRQLQDENRKLGEENKTLRHQVDDLELQVARSQVAVHAMSSAVGGLEGWINNSPTGPRPRSTAHTPAHTPRTGRVVVRGQGRFRGRYFVDDPNGEVVLGAAESVSDTRELHDGVKSWLKGFRDVEEELFRASPPRVIRSKDTRSERAAANDPDTDDDQIDWGEFESVSAT
ncbi:hypothetical protein DV735_g552, partial [Chaetothyriales sp. CBS 134920]